RTHIVRSHYAYSSGFEAPCALVAALYWYEQRLGVLARERLGRKITRIEHYGTYACRNIYNRTESRRSAHATAGAIDISGFRFDDGTSVSVLRDWGEDTAKGRFLAAARDEACRFFGIVLSPAYNEAHANHFHLELGRFGLCR
ncbi:MAG TPA: extensin family protein, partial [Bryobacteraceae bacterium]|nr:extensin family protein [Bryobacteraceae bacterium]